MSGFPLLFSPLTAGKVRVVPRMSGERRRILGGRSTAPADETLAEVEGPWGHLRISADGNPLVVRAHIDGQIVATLTEIIANLHEDGPVLTFADRDVPLSLGNLHTDVRFVAQGSRLRPAGRKRFLRVTSAHQAWTYGSSETQTATDHPVGKILGTANYATELRRGTQPGTGEVITSWVDSTPRDEKDPSGRPYLTLSWVDGTTIGEIVLTLLLHLGTNDVRLSPLWWRAVDLGGSF